jgi:hypothetical protein
MWADVVYAKWREISPGAKRIVSSLGSTGKEKTTAGDMVDGIFHWAPLALNFFRSIR